MKRPSMQSIHEIFISAVLVCKDRLVSLHMAVPVHNEPQIRNGQKYNNALRVEWEKISPSRCSAGLLMTCVR